MIPKLGYGGPTEESGALGFEYRGTDSAFVGVWGQPGKHDRMSSL